jgi:AcrR family transcriptional regulator
MKPKSVYLFLCVLGFVVPYAEFLPWVAEYGLNLRLFVQHLFANRISAFFGMDVIVSAIVLLRFAAVESNRLRIPHRWFVLLATLLVGVSLGLPLFLYLRERRLEQIPATS